MFLHNYAKLHDFMKDYPDVSPERLLSISDSLFYASKLLGKTVQDIEQVTTDKQLHEISQILHVTNYKNKKKTCFKTRDHRCIQYSFSVHTYNSSTSCY